MSPMPNPKSAHMTPVLPTHNKLYKYKESKEEGPYSIRIRPRWYVRTAVGPGPRGRTKLRRGVVHQCREHAVLRYSYVRPSQVTVKCSVSGFLVRPALPLEKTGGVTLYIPPRRERAAETRRTHKNETRPRSPGKEKLSGAERVHGTVLCCVYLPCCGWCPALSICCAMRVYYSHVGRRVLLSLAACKNEKTVAAEPL